MSSPAHRLYDALHAIACDNQSAVLRDGLSHRDYTSDEVFALESQRIFDRSWICLGHVAELPEPGDYVVASIVNQEVLVVRGDDNIVRTFRNVCRHRGHALATGRGCTRRFTCPYHAWTYSSDGSLFHAPHTDEVNGLETETLGLAPIRLQIVGGAVFVNLDSDAPDFDQCYPGLSDELDEWAPDPTSLEVVYETPTPHEANWKASVENFSECYHCGPVHKYLTDNIIDPSSYEVAGDGLVQRHVVGGRDPSMIQRLWHIWPNSAMGWYPLPGVGMVWCIRHMYPRRTTESIYHYRWFATAGQSVDAIRDYAIHHESTTGAEDAAIVAGAQRGMNGDPNAANVLVCNPANSMGSEHVIGYFHDLVRAATATP